MHRLLAASVEFIAAGAEEVLENVAIGKCIVDGIEVALRGVEYVPSFQKRSDDSP